MNEVGKMNMIHIWYIFRYKFRSSDATYVFCPYKQKKRVNQSLKIRVL